jgi:hypothetical protein
VFTARYALSPYIKQIRFVFKGLNSQKINANRPPDSNITYSRHFVKQPLYNFKVTPSNKPKQYLAKNVKTTPTQIYKRSFIKIINLLDSVDENSYQTLPTPNTKFQQNPLKYTLRWKRRCGLTNVFTFKHTELYEVPRMTKPKIKC